MKYFPKFAVSFNNLTAHEFGSETKPFLSILCLQKRKMPGCLAQHSEFTRQNIMTAILQTAGPVSTRYAIRQNWRFLRSVPSEEFVKAARDLEKLNLGTVVCLEHEKAISSRVFLKKPPIEVMGILNANPSLCFPEIYMKRYKMPTTKSITFAVRAKLVKMKLVSEKQFI